MKGIDKIRHCEICGNQLSRYNPEDICFHHTPGVPIFDWSPVTLCTSYRGLSNIDTEGMPSPGDPGYNELAFIQSISGVVNEDGEVVDLNI